MKVGDEVYYERTPGVFVKAKIITNEHIETFGIAWDDSESIEYKTANFVPRGRLVPENVYQSPLWKAVYEKLGKENEQA